LAASVGLKLLQRLLADDEDLAMRACTITIPLGSHGVRELPALVVEPGSDHATASILLFLHGKGEAGSSLGALPLVCVHQTPPFQALLGRLPGTVVIAPQAPPIPTIDDWNWREYVTALAEFLADRYAKQRVVATGFSRGGLGVLQLVSAYPDLVQAWAVVDPQPARDPAETNAVLPSPARTERGWLRYGFFRHRNDAWKTFSSLLFDRLPEENRDTAELQHVEMAVQAYLGSSLSAGIGKKNLYDFLGLKFAPSPSSGSTASTPTTSAK
jgi:pimeloyl-ACP methyl ester carboxylesterase